MKTIFFILISLIHIVCFCQYDFNPSTFQRGISTGESAILPYKTSVSEWSDIIQDGIDRFDHLVIGTTITDTFIINKPLILRDDIQVTINGIIMIDDAVIQTLATDFNATNYVDVPNGSAFRVGQWIAISDDTEPLVGGGAGFTRRYSQSTYITSIVSNRLNLGETITHTYTVSNNATIGTSNSVFISDTCNNITIDGNGGLYGNAPNQYNHGYYNAGRNYEQCRMGNGIAFYANNNIRISGISIEDFDLHGITTWGCEKIYADNITLKHAISKNWLFYNCTEGQIINSVADSAEFEDGFMFYYGNERFLLSNCIANYNGRIGFGLNSTNTEIQISNCYAQGNGMNFYSGLTTNSTISNFISKDGGQIRHNPTNSYSPVKVSVCNNITFNNLIVDGYVDYSEAHYQVLIQGDSKYITFNGGVFCNTDHITTANGYGIALVTSDTYTPINIVLNGVVFHDLKNAFGLINDAIDRISFRDCIFFDNTSVGVVRESARFYNCKGLVLQETGTITMGAAVVLVYGSTHAADYTYPDIHRFQFYFKGNNGGASTKIWCDWTSSNDYPANNFRVNVDIAPGVSTEIVWVYDHNIGQ